MNCIVTQEELILNQQPEDQFSGKDHAKIYASYRKDTPPELVQKIISFLKEKHNGPLVAAADVGCGNGQSTVILAPFFKSVYGLDTSEAQISEATATRSLPNVIYRVSPAEKLPFEDSSLQLVTAATAFHWFDLNLFFPEVKRILSPNGVLAVYTYMTMKALFKNKYAENEVNRIYERLYEELYPYFVGTALKLAFENYKTIEFPFEQVVRCDPLQFDFPGSLSDIVNYVSTFSGLQNYRKAKPKEADACLEAFKKRLYEIGAKCNVQPDDEITLYREFNLTLCRNNS